MLIRNMNLCSLYGEILFCFFDGDQDGLDRFELPTITYTLEYIETL